MRVVGGSWRGRPLEAPTGREITRPTTDRIRESMASMLLSAMNLNLSGASVLDAFAGSGALGIELLSRGAAHSTFVERDRAALACLKTNLASLNAGSRARIVRADALGLPGRAGLWGAPFSIVLLDPPYALKAERVATLVAGLQGRGWLAGDALVLYEHRSKEPGLTLAGARQLSERSHGITTTELVRMS